MTTRRRLNVHSAARVVTAEHLIDAAIEQLHDAANRVRRDPDFTLLQMARAESDLRAALLELYKARMNEPVEE